MRTGILKGNSERAPGTVLLQIFGSFAKSPETKAGATSCSSTALPPSKTSSLWVHTVRPSLLNGNQVTRGVARDGEATCLGKRQGLGQPHGSPSPGCPARTALPQSSTYETSSLLQRPSFPPEYHGFALLWWPKLFFFFPYFPTQPLSGS